MLLRGGMGMFALTADKDELDDETTVSISGSKTKE